MFKLRKLYEILIFIILYFWTSNLEKFYPFLMNLKYILE